MKIITNTHFPYIKKIIFKLSLAKIYFLLKSFFIFRTTKMKYGNDRWTKPKTHVTIFTSSVAGTFVLDHFWKRRLKHLKRVFIVSLYRI